MTLCTDDWREEALRNKDIDLEWYSRESIKKKTKVWAGVYMAPEGEYDIFVSAQPAGESRDREEDDFICGKSLV